MLVMNLDDNGDGEIALGWLAGLGEVGGMG